MVVEEVTDSKTEDVIEDDIDLVDGVDIDCVAVVIGVTDTLVALDGIMDGDINNLLVPSTVGRPRDSDAIDDG